MTPPASTKYFVFARKKADQPLAAVGELAADSSEAVARLARERFGEEWLELVAVPADAASWAIREES